MAQTAVVTGSSRDMGRFIALRLARDGFDVAVHYAQAREAADETVELIGKAGATAEAFQADLTRPEGGEALIGGALERFGAVHALVCNVGGFLRKPFVETSAQEWRTQFELNADSMFHCVRAAVPAMREQRYGRIITFSAAGAEQPSTKTQFSVYAAAKAAVVAFSRALARELAPEGITVNVIAPGVISETAATRENAREIGFVKHTPVGRVGSFDDVANAVAFLANPDADYVTGTILEVGGGWRL